MNRTITLIEPFFNLASKKEKIRVRLGFRVGHATMASSTKPHTAAPEYYRAYSRPNFSTLPHPGGQIHTYTVLHRRHR